MRITFICLLICLVCPSFESSIVDCNYDNYDFYAVGYKYRCDVSNNLNITSPESAEIIAVNGTHMSGKSNNDEIYFHATDKQIEYFPRELEKFFTKLTGIVIWRSKLREIHQDDLKPYSNLKYLSLVNNNIEVIEDELFDYQPDIETINLEKSNIFHISPTVFDNLPKLTSLYLDGNNCTSEESTNSRTGVIEVINSVKSTCVSFDFSKLNEKLRNLENSFMNLNRRNFTVFKKNFQNFEAELENSKLSKFQTLLDRSSIILFVKEFLLSDRIVLIENWKNTVDDTLMKIKDENSELNLKIKIQSEVIDAQNTTLNNMSRIQNPWIIIATAVVGFTQTIILAVIYKQFLA